MKCVYGWAGERTGVCYVKTKFSRMDSLRNFVTHGAPLRVLRARESSAINTSAQFKSFELTVLKNENFSNICLLLVSH